MHTSVPGDYSNFRISEKNPQTVYLLSPQRGKTVAFMSAEKTSGLGLEGFSERKKTGCHQISDQTGFRSTNVAPM